MQKILHWPIFGKNNLILIFICLLLSLTPFFSPEKIHAQDFEVFYNTKYTVDNLGKASVLHEITLVNKESTIYAPSYTLTVFGKKPTNIAAYDYETIRNKIYRRSFENKVLSGEETSIVVKFPDSIVGKDKVRKFYIGYDLDNIAQKNGEVWDVLIPKLNLEEQINSYELEVDVPKTFGNLAYISPEASSKSTDTLLYRFLYKDDKLTKSGISASFGDFQLLKFSLKYHLYNPSLQKAYSEIVLPPDTAFQKTYYNLIEPKPEEIYLDDDGNFMAKYLLDGNRKIDVIADLTVQVFSKPQERYHKINGLDYPFYLSETNYWQTNDSMVRQYGSVLNHPKTIYDFVINKLEYDYQRVNKTSLRYGAKNILFSPNEAICTDYTDLFIALSRSAGIPAREINGFAYTENPSLQPLSLVADVLHAWPEYWDDKDKIWRPVDPTWEDTSNIDYFNKFDLYHVVFAIHGKQDNYPLAAGSYKSEEFQTRDVQFEFGSLPKIRQESTKIELSSKYWSLPFAPIRRDFQLINNGMVAIYNEQVKIESEGVNLLVPNSRSIDFLAPYDKVVIPIEFAVDLIPKFKPMKIKIASGSYNYEYDIPVFEVYALQVLTLFTLLLATGGLIFFMIHSKRLLKIILR